MNKKAYIQPLTMEFQADLSAMIAVSLNGTTGGEDLPGIVPGEDDGTTDAGARDNKFFNFVW